MKKPGSLVYLKKLSDMVIKFDAEMPSANPEERAVEWRKIFMLALEIKEAIGLFKKVKQ